MNIVLLRGVLSSTPIIHIRDDTKSTKTHHEGKHDKHTREAQITHHPTPRNTPL